MLGRLGEAQLSSYMSSLSCVRVLFAREKLRLNPSSKRLWISAERVLLDEPTEACHERSSICGSILNLWREELPEELKEWRRESRLERIKGRMLTAAGGSERGW